MLILKETFPVELVYEQKNGYCHDIHFAI